MRSVKALHAGPRSSSAGPGWVLAAFGLAMVLLLPTALAGAQQLVPLGAEFRVNTYTTHFQGVPSVSSGADGDFVVVWYGSDQRGDSFDVFGQRYQSSGAALSGEFRVNTYTTSLQRNPSVSSDVEGDFVVVWESIVQDGDMLGIFGQRFRSNGAALGGEFRVNTYTTHHQSFPSVSSDAEGDFVVVWRSALQDGSNYGIFGQRFRRNGAALSREFRVNTYTTLFQSAPSVSSAADGDFVVVWYSSDSSQYCCTFGIFGQRYRSSGAALGMEFRVNAFGSADHREPSVSTSANGDFVVVWEADSSQRIHGQRYRSSGAPLGTEFIVNTFVAASQRETSISSDADGDFVVVWQNYIQNYIHDIYGQRFQSSGAPLGREFRVNTYTIHDQVSPAVSSDSHGNFVVVWRSTHQEDSDRGVFGQRFGIGQSTPPSTPTPPVRLLPSNPGGSAPPLVFAVLLSALALLGSHTGLGTRLRDRSRNRTA